jgi:phenylpyruvate tautomerase PptA (4-oxalocrotonate tautomerase family)
MPYLRLDLTKTYPSQTKRELAARLCRLYADVMQTQLWRPNVGIAELGEDNLFHLGADGLEPVTMVLGGAARPINVSNSGGVSSTSVVRCWGFPEKRYASNSPFIAATRCCVTANGPATGPPPKHPRQGRLRLRKVCWYRYDTNSKAPHRFR